MDDRLPLAIDPFAYLVTMKVATKLNFYPPVEILQSRVEHQVAIKLLDAGVFRF